MTSTTRPIVLYSTLATAKAFEAGLLDDFTARTGIDIERHYDPTTELQRRLERGERADVLVSTTPSIPSIAAATGILDVGTQLPLVSSVIGLAVRSGEAVPAIGTVEELAETLRSARSVAFSLAGQSGIYFRRLIAQLGVADEVEARATAVPKGFTGEAVVDGRASLAIQQLSELAFVEGVDIVGPLPAELQHVTEFSAVLAAEPDVHPAAGRLLEAFREDHARELFTSSGMTPIGA